MKTGIIDIGSNTMRLSIYSVNDDGSFENLMNKKEMVGLAGYIDQGKMSDEGIERAIATLNRFKNIAQDFNLDQCYALATAPFRNIDNANEALTEIQERVGIAIDAISGEQEALLDFNGAMLQSNMNDGLLIDIGGGSTELVCFKDRKILQAVSLPIGSLSAYNRFFKTLYPSKKQINALQDHVKDLLQYVEFIQTQDTSQIIGVGGSIRACNKLYRRKYGIKENKSLTYDQIKEIYKDVKSLEGNHLDLVLKAIPDRIHTIRSGLIILKTIMSTFDGESLHISNYGVREGYLNSKLHN